MITKDQLSFDIDDLDSTHYLCQCKYCNTFFKSIRRKMYCSTSCKQRAYYVRNGLRNDARKNNIVSAPTDVIQSTYRIQKSIPMNDKAHLKKPSISKKTDRPKNPEAQIKELEKKLANSTLKALALEEMILVAEQYYNVPIRKKLGAKQ